MILFLIVLLVVLVAALLLRRVLPGVAGPAGGLAAVIGIVFGVIVMFTGPPDEERLQLAIHEASGWMLGETFKQHFPQGGEVLLLRYPDGDSSLSRLSAARLKGFRAGCGDLPLDLVQAGPVPAGASVPTGFAGFEGADLWGNVQAELRRHADCAAVVSLLPLLEDLRPSRLRGLPPFYVYLVGREQGVQKMLEQGNLHAAVRFRKYLEGPREKVGHNADPAILFGSRYQLLTAENPE